MTTMDRIQDFLAQKRLAVAGVSRESKHFSRVVFRELRSRGYDAVPIHPEADEIEGQHCARDFSEIDPPVDAVLFLTKPDVTDTLAGDCIQSGIHHAWVYRASPDAVRRLEKNGVSVVAGECPLMYLPHSALIHRAHGWVRKITGSYPK